MAGSDSNVITYTLKLRLRPAQERMFNRWLWHLTGVYNWTHTSNTAEFID